MPDGPRAGRKRAVMLLPAGEGYLPYIWLVYVAMTFVYPAMLGSLSSLLATVAVALVFLALYFRGYWAEGRTLFTILVAIAALGAGLGPFNPVASVYFVYAAAFAPYVASISLGWRIIGGLIAAILIEGALLHLSPFFWGSGALFTAIIGAACVRSAETTRANEQLRVAHDEVERLAKVAERERIARDLHDVLGHTLSVIVLKSELAAKLSDSDASRAAAEIRDVERIARESLAELREALAGYRAAGVAAEIDRAREVLGAAGVRFECELADMRLAPRTESVLALAIREAVTNVVRHARASTCHLSLSRDPQTLRLRIDDDGPGLGRSERPAEGEGLGLRGMRERVEALGGTLARGGANGTGLELTIPASVR